MGKYLVVPLYAVPRVAAVGTYIPHMSVNLVSRVPGNLPKQAGNPTELGIVRCNMVTCQIYLGYLGT